MHTTGEKIIARSKPVVAQLFQPMKALWALTNQRIFPIETSQIPRNQAQNTEFRISEMKKGEELITLFTLPDSST